MSSTNSSFFRVSEPHPGVIHVELSKNPVNAWSRDFWKAYGKLFDVLEKECSLGKDIRVAVVSSAIPKIFTAGLDLKGAGVMAPLPGGSDTGREVLANRYAILDFQRCIGAPDRCRFPVIVAVHGPVIGLGVDIIAACDIRYASSNAAFSIKEVDVGLAPDIGTLAFLPKIVGNQSLARELTYTGRSFNAQEAFSMGLVSRVVDGGQQEVVAAALDLAKTIASKSPVAVVSSKQFLNHARDHSVQEALEYTAIWNAAAVLTKDIPENIKAMKTKSPPQFQPFSVSAKL